MRTVDTPEVASRRLQSPDLDAIAAQWQLALDSAERALSAADGSFPSSQLARRRSDLAHERQRTAEMLAGLARLHGIQASGASRVVAYLPDSLPTASSNSP